MTFDEILAQVIALRRRAKRVSSRALQRRFTLDEASLDDLQVEIIEARQLTVLCCDLVDSTTLAGQLDPEDCGRWGAPIRRPVPRLSSVLRGIAPSISAMGWQRSWTKRRLGSSATGVWPPASAISEWYAMGGGVSARVI